MTTTHFSSRLAIGPAEAARMDTAALRAHFLVEDLFAPGTLRWTYSHYDRMALGGAVPGAEPLALEAIAPVGTASFLARRELVAVNIGGAGWVERGSERFAAAPRDMVYLGQGSEAVRFGSEDPGDPARFYLVSAPAHAALPSRRIRIEEAKRLEMGTPESANQRTIFQFIHPEGARTCQLVVGMTIFDAGSVWNTMPPHLHDRRSEAYLYFDLEPKARVIHLMGEPQETRHLVVGNEQAVLSPPWSIHAGAGTARYAFIWAMAGDNVDYTDVDPAPVETLR